MRAHSSAFRLQRLQGLRRLLNDCPRLRVRLARLSTFDLTVPPSISQYHRTTSLKVQERWHRFPVSYPRFRGVQHEQNSQSEPYGLQS